MTTVYERWPTAEEIQTHIHAPLQESYWWLTGMNYNRPVIVVIWNKHEGKGMVPHVRYPGMKEGGVRTADTRSGGFVLSGPIRFDEEAADVRIAKKPEKRVTDYPCVVKGRITKVSVHAIERFRERGGCTKKDEAVVCTFQALIANAIEMRLKKKFRVIEMLNHGIDNEETHYFSSGGWVFVVKHGIVLTVHAGEAKRWEKME